MSSNAKPIPELTEKDLSRFWFKVDKSGGCWIWVASKTTNGYGRFRVTSDGGTSIYLAHRISYVLAYGQIPGGQVLDHSVACGNKACVNPEHMRVCTVLDNNMAWDGGITKSAEARRSITHCPQGHEYTEENTRLMFSPSHPGGCRQCRECIRQSNREAYRRKSGYYDRHPG